MTKIDKLLIFGFLVMGTLGTGLLIQNILVKGPVWFTLVCGLYLGIAFCHFRALTRGSEDKDNNEI